MLFIFLFPVVFVYTPASQVSFFVAQVSIAVRFMIIDRSTLISLGVMENLTISGPRKITLYPDLERNLPLPCLYLFRVQTQNFKSIFNQRSVSIEY